MLTKYQEKALIWLHRCYFHIEEVPIIWDSRRKQVSTNLKLRKWVFWWIGNIFVFVLWLTCVYTLSTQFIFHRKGLKVLPICILTTGFCCFSATLASAYGITALRNKLYVSSINEYISLEVEIYKKYFPETFDPNCRITTLDTFSLFAQCFNFLPYLIFVVCIVWNLDGPYWVLEDIAQDANYRSISTNLAFLLIRTVLLIPGFLETTRTIIYSCLGYLSVITYLEEIVNILSHKVRSQKDFFRYYCQLYILSNILGPGFERAGFLGCSAFYFLFIQTFWICVCGFGNLDLPIYLFFATYALVVLLGTAMYLHIVAQAGEVINDIRRIKLKQIKRICCPFKTDSNKVYLKKSVALHSIRFSYGSYYPLGKRCCRNIFDNGVQTLLSMVLLFDLSGRKQ